jgi:hypothetical protein
LFAELSRKVTPSDALFAVLATLDRGTATTPPRNIGLEQEYFLAMNRRTP